MNATAPPVRMRRPLPPIFDRLAVLLAVQAHVVAAISILENRTAYRSVPICWSLFLISLAVPLTCVVVARRAGGDLSTRAFLTASAVLLAVDVAVSVLSPGVDAGASASWTWGTIGVTVLIFAAFRPAQEVLLLAAAHSLVAVAVLISQAGNPNVDVFRVVFVLSETAIPALAAAQYLRLYIRAVGLREAAAAARLAMETRTAAQRAVQEDAERRLGALRAEVVPMLTDIASGETTVNDPAVADRARRLARDLRRELVDSRSGRWLLETTRRDKYDDWPGVVLLDPQGLLPRLRNLDRAALLALLDMLRNHPNWQRVSVALGPGFGAAADFGRANAVSRGNAPAAALTVVATGPAATSSLNDPQIVAAAAKLGALTSTEAGTVLIVETTVPLLHPRDPSPEGVLPADLHKSSSSGRS